MLNNSDITVDFLRCVKAQIRALFSHGDFFLDLALLTKSSFDLFVKFFHLTAETPLVFIEDRMKLQRL